jgi:hypothetical protein
MADTRLKAGEIDGPETLATRIDPEGREGASAKAAEWLMWDRDLSQDLLNSVKKKQEKMEGNND